MGETKPSAWYRRTASPASRIAGLASLAKKQTLCPDGARGHPELGRPRRMRVSALASRLVEPHGVHAHDVVDAEIVLGIVTFDVVVPDVVDLLPTDGKHRHLLLEDLLGPTDGGHALGGIDLTV